MGEMFGKIQSYSWSGWQYFIKIFQAKRLISKFLENTYIAVVYDSNIFSSPIFFAAENICGIFCIKSNELLV